MAFSEVENPFWISFHSPALFLAYVCLFRHPSCTHLLSPPPPPPLQHCWEPWAPKVQEFRSPPNLGQDFRTFKKGVQRSSLSEPLFKNSQGFYRAGHLTSVPLGHRSSDSSPVSSMPWAFAHAGWPAGPPRCLQLLPPFLHPRWSVLHLSQYHPLSLGMCRAHSLCTFLPLVCISCTQVTISRKTHGLSGSLGLSFSRFPMEAEGGIQWRSLFDGVCFFLTSESQEGRMDPATP